MNGADGVIMIGEVWRSRVSIDQDGVMIPPAEAPDRQEMLEVYGEIAGGPFRVKHVVFRKRLGRILFGEEYVTTESLINNMLAPTRNIWASRSKDQETKFSEEIRRHARRAHSAED